MLVKEAEIILNGGPEWKDEYLVDEDLFCKEILLKLLNQMKFRDIESKHGMWEFGKDFTFSETTVFGIDRHYAIQAKAGNISGAVNPPAHTKTTDGKKVKVTSLEGILVQLDDAFSVPYRYKDTSEQRFISTFVIAITGELTENAKEKMSWKLQRAGRLGMVYLLDRNKIEQLIRTYWLRDGTSPDPQQWWLTNDALTVEEHSKE